MPSETELLKDIPDYALAPLRQTAFRPGGDVGLEIVELMGLRLHNLHRDVIAAKVVDAVMSQQKLLVVNANAHMMVLAQQLPWICGLFRSADIAFCDGAGVQLATRLLKGRGIHRTTPPEWIGTALRSLGADASIFWLGGEAAVAEAAARRFEALYGVRTAGVQHGFFETAPGSSDTLAVVNRINAAGPSILLINMGMPLQERWLWENWERLPNCVAITAGALVDHAAGRVKRPPRWVANLGVEWLIRLLHEPRRLWRRYLLGLPVFGFYVLRYALLSEPDTARTGGRR
jgi:N-acetylglucosaminyldiphosphoundecaprenol N-acetyl-beta-D-mannosaminyltransferase